MVSSFLCFWRVPELAGIHDYFDMMMKKLPFARIPSGRFACDAVATLADAGADLRSPW